MNSTLPQPDPIAGRVVDLARAMRGHGLAVGTSEVTDGGLVMRALGMADRMQLREGLAAAMCRRHEDRPTFNALYDVYFPLGAGRRAVAHATSAEEFRAQLVQALADADRTALNEIAAAAVELLGRVPGSDPDRGWSSQQTIDRLAPQLAIAPSQQRARAQQGGPGASDGTGPGTGNGTGGTERLTDRIDRDEIRDRVGVLRQDIEAEARRRNAEVRDRDRVAKFGVATALDQREFLAMGTKDLDEMRRQLEPLAKKLAAKLHTRARSGRGAIDVRRTLRTAMSTGGIPIDPQFHHRKRHRPDLVLLCDLSGSVGGLSMFTMLLMQALQSQFRRVRIFGFVSSTAEITDVVRTAPRGASLTSWALKSGDLTRRGSSSSYGTALTTFVRGGGLDAIGPRTTVLILGDARTNYGDPRVADLVAIKDKARHVVWLNPERAGMWSTGDSVARVYAQLVQMHECRNLDQLRAFVAQLLPV